MASLEARNVSVRFGSLIALNDVSLTADSGAILGLIGPNGAGKTTLVNVLSGFQKTNSGEILCDNVNLKSLNPQQRSYRGLVRTFQGARIFRSMSVRENAMVGAMAQGMSVADAWIRADAMLTRMGLAAYADLPVARLTYGQERALDLARALCTNPKFLLLDEPAAGMNEGETAILNDALRTIVGDLGIGIVLIEHDMSLVMSCCDRIHVLVKGETLVCDTPAAVRANSQVIFSYLGSSAGRSA